jgi:hypothetical protein
MNMSIRVKKTLRVKKNLKTLPTVVKYLTALMMMKKLKRTTLQEKTKVK